MRVVLLLFLIEQRDQELIHIISEPYVKAEMKNFNDLIKNLFPPFSRYCRLASISWLLA